MGMKSAAAMAIVSSVFCLTLFGQQPPPIAQWTMLWPEAAPGALGTADRDPPSVSIFMPPAERATGSAVVVGPGGGYQMLALDPEGKQVADWLKVSGFFAAAAQTPGGDSRR